MGIYFLIPQDHGERDLSTWIPSKSFYCSAHSTFNIVKPIKNTFYGSGTNANKHSNYDSAGVVCNIIPPDIKKEINISTYILIYNCRDYLCNFRSFANIIYLLASVYSSHNTLNLPTNNIHSQTTKEYCSLKPPAPPSITHLLSSYWGWIVQQTKTYFHRERCIAMEDDMGTREPALWTFYGD